MPDPLFADGGGPEGRNRDSQLFEAQLRSLCDTLAWRIIECNVDMFLADDQKDAGGVDIVIAYRHPQVAGTNVGWLLEGKRHDTGARYTPKLLTTEIQRLRTKVASLDGKKRFAEHDRVRPHIDRLVGGVLAHHCSKDYDADRTQEALERVTLTHFQNGPEPLRIAYLGPDTLNGLAEAFEMTGTPKEFLWPVGIDRPQKWAAVCPPEQLAAGLLAYRTEDGKTILWLRDGLEFADIPALERIARAWGIVFDTVLVTELTQETLSRRRGAWEEAVRNTRDDDGPGELPEDIRALELTNANMREFNKRWPASAA